MFELIIDTREQEPLHFKKEVFEFQTSEKLEVGDYGCRIDGELFPIIFERKSKGDLYSTMTSGYERFRKEILRASELDIKLVLLIEGSMKQVQAGFSYSNFDGDSMLKKLAMLYVKYDLEYHFHGGRREMARKIEDTFCAVNRFWKKKSKDVKKSLIA